MHTEQQDLFDKQPAPWELDAAQTQAVASVVFAAGPEKPFDYRVPEALSGQVEPGRRLHVPFGRAGRIVVGYCVRLETRQQLRPLKDVADVIDHRPLLSPAMLRLTEWMADYYMCPWATVLEAVLPAGVRSSAGTRRATLLSVPTRVAARLTELKLPKKQHDILRYLAASPRPLTPTQLAAAQKCTTGPIQELRKKGLIEAVKGQSTLAAPPRVQVNREQHLEMNADQLAALAAIRQSLDAREHRTILMHGITGSGKTEVYIQAIAEVISYGRQAIVLVPEISLTPQTQERFRSRFERVAVLHSHLTDVERHQHWQEIARGEVQVIVGARSAVFAPTPHLGLIVLDEEHEGSFKQDSAPRYHARDVALFRAAAENVPVVLGSATPSLESWHRAQQGQYQLVSLPRRVFDRPLPIVGTIDLRNEYQSRRSRGAIGRQLQLAIEEALREQGQVILLLNRRGFSTHIQCPACGKVVKCPNCELALTHHKPGEMAICHMCEFEQPAPRQCPDCDFVGIQYAGLGTQRLEAEVRARFPDVTCLRMDTDTMQAPGSHERALAKFRSGEVKILLGTQMIAKGLDFPNVTLVGVINADTALHLPDFRAAERTFQLVTQVAGRTGRGAKGGRVLVQTFSPEHPAIQAAVKHDFEMFASDELPIRDALSYPPYASMVRMVMRGPSEPATHEFAKHLAGLLQLSIAKFEPTARVLGPAPCPMAKLRGLYRFHLQLHGPNLVGICAAVREATANLQQPDEIQWIVDVDPLEML